MPRNCSPSPAQICMKLAFALIATSLAVSSGSAAPQWATSYTEPQILGGGTNVRAGSVMALADGGVVAAFETITGGVREVHGPKFAADSTQIFAGDELRPNVLFTEKLTLLAPSESYAYSLVSQLASPSPGQDGYFDVRQYVNSNGEWSGSSSRPNWIVEAVEQVAQENACIRAYFNPWDGKLGIYKDGPVPSNEAELLPGELVKDFDLLQSNEHYCSTSYTKSGPQPATPAEIWFVTLRILDTDTLTVPVQVEEQSSIHQSNSALTSLGGINIMVTWIGELDGQTKLYAKVLNQFGTEVSSVRETISDVTDYVATSSTLGLPVFAAVQRDSLAQPPVDTLIGGLMNPANGGTLSIPVASAAGIKLKALQQETNGDFSLVYSIPENGTNLLKVRRISGVSGGTLWETTVADVGMVSDKILEHYPNTFISSNTNNVLYILARYDQPGTANSNFQLIRLNANGQMGAD